MLFEARHLLFFLAIRGSACKHVFEVGTFSGLPALACEADENNLIYLVCASANHFFYGTKLRWMGFS